MTEKMSVLGHRFTNEKEGVLCLLLLIRMYILNAVEVLFEKRIGDYL